MPILESYDGSGSDYARRYLFRWHLIQHVKEYLDVMQININNVMPLALLK